MVSVKPISQPKAKLSQPLRNEILQTYVIYSIETFCRLGFTPQQLLKGVPLSENDLARANKDTMAMVKHQYLIQIYQNALALSSKPNLGLLFGAEMGMSAYGVVSYAILATQKDLDAIQMAVRYQRLILGEFAEFDLAYDEDTCEIRFAVHSDDERLKRFYVDHFFANSVGFSKAIVSHANTIRQLRLSFDDPGYRQQYEQLFGCEVVFNCAHNAIVFDPASLVFDLPNTNMATAQACSHVCDELLESLIDTSSVASQSAQLLTQNFSYYNDMQRVAEHFHCDQRTLRRKLAIDNSSFRGIRDQVFASLATKLLGEGYAIAKVAELLGYASPRTFRKAYTTVTGLKDDRQSLNANDNSETPAPKQQA